MESSMGPPPPPVPGGSRGFGGGLMSAQTPGSGEKDEFDINKPPPKLDTNGLFSRAQQAATEDLDEIEKILTEFEEVGHEFELWSRRLVSVENENDAALNNDVKQLRDKYKEQEEKREWVLEFVRVLTNARNAFQMSLRGRQG